MTISTYVFDDANKGTRYIQFVIANGSLNDDVSETIDTSAWEIGYASWFRNGSPTSILACDILIPTSNFNIPIAELSIPASTYTQAHGIILAAPAWAHAVQLKLTQNETLSQLQTVDLRLRKRGL